MKSRSLRHSLKWKTSLIVVTVLVSSMTLCGALLTEIVERKLKSETIHAAELDAKLAVQQLDDQFSYMQQAYYGVLFDTQIQEWLLSSNTDLLFDGMKNKLDTLLMASNYKVFSIYVKNFRNNMLYSTEAMSWLQSANYGDEPDESAFTSPKLEFSKSYINSTKLISLSGQMRKDDFGEPLAWISVNVQQALFTSILKDDDYYEDAMLLLMDNEGTPIAHGSVPVPDDLVQDVFIAQTGDVINYAGERYLMVAAQTENYQWQYRKMLPESQIFSEVYRLRTVLLIVLLLVGLILGIVMYQILHYITDPIYELSDRVRSYRLQSKDNKWEGSFHTNRQDEFAYLYQSLQEMTERIDQLIDQEYKAQVYKKETQLRIYRNAINPHFLYNILDSLLWVIRFGNYQKAEQILQNFSVFLHHVLSVNKEYVSVAAMREELSTFCELSAFLKDDMIRWDVCFEPEILDWNIPSFLVQPLVENCFKHAFRGRKNGTVEITGKRQENDLLFQVKDDGVGMSAPQREELITYLNTYDFNKEDEHFGIASVHQRLRLYYGEKYGLEIESQPQCGTMVRLRIPISELKHNNEVE